MTRTNSKPSDLPPNDLRKLKARHADIKGTSPAMKDKSLTPETKGLIQDQAYETLTEQGWLGEEKRDSPSLTNIVVSALTLGIFGGNS
jgi:hypothetical protein